MRDLTQKIGYLKGLRDSLGADPNEPTNRITNLMIDVLDGLTETVDELINEHQELNDYVASIDDDLADLESRNKSGDFPEGDFDDEEDAPAPHTRGHLRVLKPDVNEDEEDEEDDEEDDEDDDDFNLAVSLCSACGRPFALEISGFAPSSLYECPHCGKHVPFKLITPRTLPTAKPVES